MKKYLLQIQIGNKGGREVMKRWYRQSGGFFYRDGGPVNGKVLGSILPQEDGRYEIHWIDEPQMPMLRYLDLMSAKIAIGNLVLADEYGKVAY